MRGVEKASLNTMKGIQQGLQHGDCGNEEMLRSHVMKIFLFLTPNRPIAFVGTSGTTGPSHRIRRHRLHLNPADSARNATLGICGLVLVLRMCDTHYQWS